MIGDLVGHYRLEEKLGEGTYGAVYRAVHLHHPGLQVAIKLMHAGLAGDARFIEALRSECGHLNELQHPGIVGFRDLHLGEGAPAVLMELLVGQDLHGRLDQGPIPLVECLRILQSVLGALAFAHGQGVVHRDIKPSNIVLCQDGRVKIVDFGIARAADGSQATQTGQILGTMDYLAPEVAGGRRADPQVDVYASGLLAWELLAGRAACPQGPPGAKIGWHMGVGAPDVRGARPDCPGWLAELVGRLSEKDPQRRPRDAGQALALLEELRGELPQEAGITGAVGRARPPGTVELSRDALSQAAETPRSAEPRRGSLQAQPPGAGAPLGAPLTPQQGEPAAPMPGAASGPTGPRSFASQQGAHAALGEERTASGDPSASAGAPSEVAASSAPRSPGRDDVSLAPMAPPQPVRRDEPRPAPAATLVPPRYQVPSSGPMETSGRPPAPRRSKAPLVVGGVALLVSGFASSTRWS